MRNKQPVLLTVLIECESFRWYVAGIDQQGNTTPLLCSEPQDLAPYIGEPFDEQANFLRHRLSGVLQRGCDRLWGKMMKPCQVVFVTDMPFQQAEDGLTQRVADHFFEWMTSPPVVFYTIRESSPVCNPHLDSIAGELLADWNEALKQGFPKMLSKCSQTDPWELVVSKPHPG
ncbi:hypothetical protein [Bremerella cremea]|uniref:hypothetical protein n=1 Tax=Bremerella cremea TaxID=1031537 RepID=UPI0031EADA7B